MAVITCCKGCVAPKRHPGCHSSCPEYLAQKAEYDRLKAENDRKKSIDANIYNSRYEKIDKARKNRRRLKQ